MRHKNLWVIAVLILAAAGLFFGWRYLRGRQVYVIEAPIVAGPEDCEPAVRFAILGDFGDDGRPAADVAALVHAWQVDFITTVGDNNYPNGSARTIDANIGQYYADYIYPYQGEYGPGAPDENRLFPALGNHDWRTGSLKPFLDYFSLPGNERYYDLVRGPVHLFFLDSTAYEPDGITADSVQGKCLQSQLATATAPWRIIHLHHAPYSSGAKHGSNPTLQWPFAAWGAMAVVAGHEHIYERLLTEDIVYFVNGLGGRRRIYPIAAEPVTGSVVRYNQDYGALLVQADDHCLNFTFFNRQGELIDSYSIFQENECAESFTPFLP